MLEQENWLIFQELNRVQQCKMKYGEAVKQSMEFLAQDERVLFIGYNLDRGSKAYGSLKDILKEKIIETPVAENLMAGLSMGLGIEDFRPVLIFERHDFMLNALDSIVNHLDKLKELSSGQYSSPVIIRAIIGSRTPINPGPQHNQDFTRVFRKMVCMPVYDPKTPKAILSTYKRALTSDHPTMIIERRDLYNLE